MAYSHLLFGGIGTLVETSQHQLDAFNRAFAAHGIDFIWSPAAYAESLKKAGGKHRLRQITLDDGRTLTEAQIADVHQTKTHLFDEAIKRDGLALRSGIAELLDKARAHDVSLAWVTTTSRDNIEAICDAVGDALSPSMFAYLGIDDDVANPKPAPDCYRAALKALDVQTAEALAIEDSPTGVSAATAAGLVTAAFPGQMHQDHDFSAADRIVISAGDLAGLL